MAEGFIGTRDGVSDGWIEVTSWLTRGGWVLTITILKNIGRFSGLYDFHQHETSIISRAGIGLLQTCQEIFSKAVGFGVVVLTGNKTVKEVTWYGGGAAPI